MLKHLFGIRGLNPDSKGSHGLCRHSSQFFKRCSNVAFLSKVQLQHQLAYKTVCSLLLTRKEPKTVTIFFYVSLIFSYSVWLLSFIYMLKWCSIRNSLDQHCLGGLKIHGWDKGAGCMCVQCPQTPLNTSVGAFVEVKPVYIYKPLVKDAAIWSITSHA